MSYRRGGFWRIDDRTGFRVRADQTSKEWNGQIVAREDFEPRHPQDFVRGRADKVAVPDPRPEPTDTFQYPPGGPFMFVLHDETGRAVIDIEGGEITIYRGQTQISPSDL